MQRNQTHNGATRKKSGYQYKKNNGGPIGKAKQQPYQQQQRRKPQQRTQRLTCGKCENVHKFKNCPTYGQQCTICQRYNHFAIACKAKNHIQSVTDIITGEDDNIVYMLGKITVNNRQQYTIVYNRLHSGKLLAFESREQF